MSTFENADEPTPEMLEMYHQHRCRGIPQTKIAAQFGITQPTVSKHIAKAEYWLRNQYREEVALFRTRMTLRLEHLYGEAVQGWEASTAVPKETTRLETKGEGYRLQDAKRRRKGTCGQHFPVQAPPARCRPHSQAHPEPILYDSSIPRATIFNQA